MEKFKRLGWVSVIFLAVVFFGSMPQAQSAEATGNAPVVAASQAAEVPATANEVTQECPWKWTIRSEALWLNRGGNTNKELLDVRVGHGRHAAEADVNASQLDFNWANNVGSDNSVMLQYQNFGLELRYFGSLHGSSSESDFDISRHRGTTRIAEADAGYNYWLNNWEMNFHWWPCSNDRYNLLVGLRYFRLSESLSGDTFEGSFRRRHHFMELENSKVTTQNQLWGAQVGIEGLLLGKREKGFSIDSSLKAGLFYNDIDNNFYDSGFGRYNSHSWDWGYSDSASRSKTPFMSELGIGLNYAFTKNIAVTTRYHLIWVDNIAVASKVGNTDSILFQGGSVGLTLSF
jgi:hypothetical protein